MTTPNNLGQQTMAQSMPVTIASNQPAIPVGPVSGTVDVSDRAGRLVGIVSVTGQPISVVTQNPVVVSPAGATVWDVSDRAARLLGVVASITNPVDVSDRAARLLGVVNSIINPVDVSDRAGRLVGIVDTELPAAVALADNLANPTTPMVGADLMVFDSGTGLWQRVKNPNSTGDGAALAQALPMAQYALNAGGTFDRIRTADPTADAAVPSALGKQAVVDFPFMFDGVAGNWNRVRGDTSGGLITSHRRASVYVVQQPAANTGATLTLAAAGAGLFHYITHIRIERSSTAALAGTASLNITTTNLGGIAWRTGNAMAAGGTQIDVDEDFTHPLRSAVANTATTIVLPVPGAAVLYSAWVTYYTGP